MNGNSPFQFGGGAPPDRFERIRRMLGGSDNPLMWGVPLYSAFGIRVRLHILFLFYIVAELIRAGFDGRFAWEAGSLTILFVLVLLHEYGHCIACRKVGGSADHIVLWPLGGLAMCDPPHHWKAELITVIGGPAVNAVLLPVFGGLVWITTGDLGAVVFNPFSPGMAAGLAMSAPSPLPVWASVGLWLAHYINFILLAFNMLVPMYPMDAGRIVQCLLWRRLGYHRSMVISVTIGLVAAVGLGVVGIVADQTMLLGVAIFGGITCFMERQRLRYAVDDAYAAAAFEQVKPAEPSRRDLKKQRKEQEHFERVEAILFKIKREGMGSLTRAEKKVLEQETRRQQGE